jgi:hypothetical protein
MSQLLVYEGTPKQLTQQLRRPPRTHRYRITVTPEEADRTEKAVKLPTEIRAAIAALPMETEGGAFSGQDHDRVLYENRGGERFL